MLLLAFATLASLRRRVSDWGAGWMWPVPTLKMGGHSYEAVITDGVGSPRGGELHHGVDIMYRRRNPADRPEYTTKTVNGVRNGSPMHFAPPGTPIVAARDGKVWSVGNTPHGWSVVIDHGKPFATYYTHLSSAVLPAHASGRNTVTGTETHVKAGDIIGWMGASPLDGEHLRHLHFEVWHGGTTNEAIDPAPEMPTWQRPTWEWTPNR